MIRVRVVHDDKIVEEGLRSCILAGVEQDLHLVGAADAADVLVLSHQRALEEIASSKRGETPCPIVVYSSARAYKAVKEAISLGVRGYLLCACTPQDVRTAVVRAALGETYTCPQAEKLLREGDRHLGLTARERDVMNLMSQGASNKEIANRLHVTEGTVKTHVKTVFTKLGVGSRTRAVVLAAQLGFLPAEQAMSFNPRVRP
ncbi:response regulator transcription factor [Roseateles noduli]|uniref:response regulator transcription factor n=1 Tax=Roseateles noduli TaxID=2052484 RepID=UPI003D65B88C